MNVPSPAAKAMTPQQQMAGAMAYLLFVLPLPLVVAAIVYIIDGRVVPFLIALGLYVAYLFAGTLVRAGLIKEAAFNAKKMARASLIPYKTLGAIVAGAATFATAWFLTHFGFFASLGFGIGAFLGSMLLFGSDPFGAKGLKDQGGIDGATVVRALEDARARLARIEVASKSVKQPHFRQDLRDVLGKAENVLAEIERDPRDLRRARKFLNVYLSGAADVTENFVETWPKSQSPELENRFQELLNDMKRVFDEQHEKLLRDDELDLDVQMEVLRTRLEKEGVL